MVPPGHRFSCYVGGTCRDGNGPPLQFSCLENPMGRGAWWAAVHEIAKSRTWPSDFPFTFHFHALKEMATHSSVLAWRIPGTLEPGGLPPLGSHRVGHDWSDLAAAGGTCCNIAVHSTFLRERRIHSAPQLFLSHSPLSFFSAPNLALCFSEKIEPSLAWLH